MFKFGQLLFEFQLGQTDILTSLNKPSISNDMLDYFRHMFSNWIISYLECLFEVKQQLCALVPGWVTATVRVAFL